MRAVVVHGLCEVAASIARRTAAKPPGDRAASGRWGSNARVVMRTRFTNFLGKYVFHCHILNHEDNGVMATVDVVR
jgi:FtsP/CotA-like multicopper oxidase with cupredoxin domain